MGICWPGCLKKRPRRRIVLILIGLDNAGKTQTVNSLVGASGSVLPTVGFKAVNLVHRDTPVTVYDLGGGPQFRQIWPQYYSEVHGVIFVVDASDERRLEECRRVLAEVISHDRISGKPILILANKQDKSGALDDIDVVERLSVEPLVNRYRCPTLVESYTAAAPEPGKKALDPGLKKGYLWLLNYIVSRYGDINLRVQTDIHAELERRKRQSAGTAEAAVTGFANPSYDTLGPAAARGPEEGVIVVKPIAYRSSGEGTVTFDSHGTSDETVDVKPELKGMGDSLSPSNGRRVESTTSLDERKAEAKLSPFDGRKGVSKLSSEGRKGELKRWSFDGGKGEPKLSSFDGGKGEPKLSSFDGGKGEPKLSSFDGGKGEPKLSSFDGGKGEPKLSSFDGGKGEPKLSPDGGMDDEGRRSPATESESRYTGMLTPIARRTRAVRRRSLSRSDFRTRPQSSPSVVEVTELEALETVEVDESADCVADSTFTGVWVADSSTDVEPSGRGKPGSAGHVEGRLKRHAELVVCEKRSPPAVKGVASDSGVGRGGGAGAAAVAARPASASQLVRRQLELSAAPPSHRRRLSLRYGHRNKTSPEQMALFHYEPNTKMERGDKGDFESPLHLNYVTQRGDMTL